MLDVIQRGVGARQADEFLQEEAQSGWRARQQFAFAGVHGAFFVPVLVVAGAVVLACHHLDLGEDGLRRFQPGGVVGVEIDFAVAVLGEEVGEVVAHVGVGVKRVVQAFGVVVARIDEFGVGAQAA